MTDLEVFGNVIENTGYGIATSNFIKSLNTLDINLKFSVRGMDDFNKLLSPNIQLHIQCPPYKKKNMRAGRSKYKIGYFYWEADRLPIQWRRSMQWLDEAWVPCKLVKKCLLKDGFSGPIEIIPTPANNSMTFIVFT